MKAFVLYNRQRCLISSFFCKTESHSKYYLTTSFVPFHLYIYFIKATFLSPLFLQLEMFSISLEHMWLNSKFQRPLSLDRSCCGCPLTCPRGQDCCSENCEVHWKKTQTNHQPTTCSYRFVCTATRLELSMEWRLVKSLKIWHCDAAQPFILSPSY